MLNSSSADSAMPPQFSAVNFLRDYFTAEVAEVFAEERGEKQKHQSALY
jgi:hypothetical protein